MKKRMILAVAAILTLAALNRIPLVSYAEEPSLSTAAEPTEQTEPTEPGAPTAPVVPSDGDVDEAVYNDREDYV